jgi:membrane-associated phospholipid phosphatase
MNSSQIPYPFKFLIPAIIISMITGFGLVILGDHLLFLKINGLMSPDVSTFLKYYTHLGDGLVFVLVSLFFLFKKRKWFYVFSGTFLLSSGISRVCKDIIFTNSPRPVKYFELEGIAIRTAEGLTTHQWSSFPSGHSITVFAMCTLLAAIFDRGWISALLSVMAVTAAFSRVYLAQHFVVDALAGSWIGISTAFFMLYVINARLKNNKMNHAEKPLILIRS